MTFFAYWCQRASLCLQYVDCCGASLHRLLTAAAWGRCDLQVCDCVREPGDASSEHLLKRNRTMLKDVGCLWCHSTPACRLLAPERALLMLAAGLTCVLDLQQSKHADTHTCRLRNSILRWRGMLLCFLSVRGVSGSLPRLTAFRMRPRPYTPAIRPRPDTPAMPRTDEGCPAPDQK